MKRTERIQKVVKKIDRWFLSKKCSCKLAKDIDKFYTKKTK